MDGEEQGDWDVTMEKQQQKYEKNLFSIDFCGKEKEKGSSSFLLNHVFLSSDFSCLHIQPSTLIRDNIEEKKK